MKKIFILAAVALMGFASCAGSKQSMTVTVTNSLALERAGEMVEVPMSDVTAKLQLADTAQIVVLNEDGQQVPYQVTYDEKVVFPATVKANGTATYTIQSGTPEPYNVIACGRYYPERLDDVAWENDLGGYRAYGPALQKRGERGFGYDLFTKYNTTEPILESLYAEELDKEKRAKIAELKKTDTIIYPYCYRTQEILDNGPLRFTVKLEFNPLTVRGDSNVVEMRVITLDAGSYLNKTVVLYTNLKEAMPVTTGIVLREPDGVVTADAANGYITYVDPTTDRSGGNGKIFIGAAFPSLVKEAKTVLFPEKEKKELRGGADGHVLAISQYEPGSEYTYHWGSAWDKAAIKTVDAWNAYMAEYAQKVRTPLTVTY